MNGGVCCLATCDIGLCSRTEGVECVSYDIRLCSRTEGGVCKL